MYSRNYKKRMETSDRTDTKNILKQETYIFLKKANLKI